MGIPGDGGMIGPKGTKGDPGEKVALPNAFMQ